MQEGVTVERAGEGIMSGWLGLTAIEREGEYDWTLWVVIGGLSLDGHRLFGITYFFNYLRNISSHITLFCPYYFLRCRSRCCLVV